MKTYITQHKPQFRTTKNNNGTITTECLIVAQLNIEKLQRKYPFVNVKQLCNGLIPKKHIFSINRGRATCSPEDQFNEATGRHLAESRAKSKMYLYYAEVFKQLEARLKECYRSFGIIDVKILSCAAHEILHSSELSK